jgi:hypothetical protein
MEYGLFNDESSDWTAEEAVESGFYSREEAEIALKTRYNSEDELIIHLVEEEEEEEEYD